MDGQGYAFEVIWNDVVGKHAIATKDIEEGEELINESPLVVWPHPKALPEMCEQCLRKKNECESCNGNEWMEFLTPESINRARSWQLQKGSDSVTLESIARAIARIMHSVTVVLERDATCPPKDALLFAAQAFNRLQTPSNELGEWTISYIEMLQSLITFPGDSSSLLSSLKETIFSKQFIDSIIGGLALNGHAVTLPSLSAGSGVYVLTATLNHSCVPSACLVMDGKSVDVIVKATRPIKTGEEITLCYVPKGLKLRERRERLKKYEFSCDCEKCKLEGA